MEYTFTLKAEMLQVIDRSLGQCPYSVVAPVIAELQRQINEQNLKNLTTVQPVNEKAA